MQAVLYIIARTAQLLLGFVELAMLARMILSWFVRNEENRFMLFLYAVTEPFVLPFRVLCRMFGMPDDFPLDIPFSFAFLAIMILNGILPAVTL